MKSITVAMIVLLFSNIAGSSVLHSDTFDTNSTANYTATKGMWAVNTSTGQLYNSIYATNARAYYNVANFGMARYVAVINVSGFTESIGFEYGGAYSVKLYPFGLGKIYLTRLSDNYNLITEEVGYGAGTYRIEVSWNPNNGVHIINITDPKNSNYKHMYYAYDMSSTSAGEFAFTINTDNNSKFDYVEINSELEYPIPYITDYSMANLNSVTNSNLNLSALNQSSIRTGYYFNNRIGYLNVNLYAIAQDRCTLLSSSDVGDTWTAIYNFCTSNDVSIGTVHTASGVAIAGEHLVVISNNSKLYRSGLNDPTTWDVVLNLTGSDPQMNIWSWYCTSNGWCIYGEYGYKGVEKTNYHVYLSQDNAETWSLIFNGTLMDTDNTNMHIHQVFIDSAKRIYVAMGDSPNMGIFVSTNNGSTYGVIEVDGPGTLAATELTDGRILFGREDGSFEIYNPTMTLTQKFSSHSNLFNDYVSGPQITIPHFGRDTRYISYLYTDPETNVIYASTSHSDKELDSSIMVTLNGIDFYELVRFTNTSSKDSLGGHSFGAITSAGDYIVIPAGNMPSYRIKKLTVAEVLQLANGNIETFGTRNLTKTISYQSGVTDGFIGFTDAIVKDPIVTISSYNQDNIIANPEFTGNLMGWDNGKGWVYDSSQGHTTLGSAYLNTSLGTGNLSQDITASFSSLNGNIGYYRLWIKSQRTNGTANIYIDVRFSDGTKERYGGNAILTTTTWVPRYYGFTIRKNKTISSVYLNVTPGTYQGILNIDDVSVWKNLYDNGRYTNGIFNTTYGSRGIYVDIENVKYNSSNHDITVGLSGLYDRVKISNVTVVSGTQKLNVSVTGMIVAKGTNVILTTQVVPKVKKAQEISPIKRLILKLRNIICKILNFETACTDETIINVDTMYSNPSIEIYQDYQVELVLGIRYNINISRSSQGRIGTNIIIPSSGEINFTPIIWNTTNDYYKKWNESSINSSGTTQYTIGDFPSNTKIQIKRDGINYATATSNSKGYINWAHDGGYIEHQFETELYVDPTPIHT